MILIGVPTHRRPELLRECLASLAAQEGSLPDLRVFVADNDAARREGVLLVEQLATTFRFPLSCELVTDPGISAVRNAILAEARRLGADMIAMIDDDVRADPQWLSKLFSGMMISGADVVAGPVSLVLPDGSGEQIRSAFTIDDRPNGSTALIHATTAVMISAKALDRLGWPSFDPAYGLTGGGDKEWFSRLQNLGARFHWIRDAQAVERVPQSRATLKWVLKRRYRIGIDDVRIGSVHGTRFSRLVLTIKAAGLLAVSPVYFPTLFTAQRYKQLMRFARAVGRLSGLFGIQFREYASRH